MPILIKIGKCLKALIDFNHKLIISKTIILVIYKRDKNF